MANTLGNFFNPIQQIEYLTGDNYKAIEDHLYALKSLSKICDLSYYVVDYYKKGFYFVSPNPLFLNGYSQEEVLKLGFDYYPLCVVEEDLGLLFKLNVAGFKFFYDLKKERRNEATISYDFRLRHKDYNSILMINHKLTPLFLDKDGNIWMAICLVTLSNRKESGDVHIVMKDDQTRHNLDLERNEFVPASPHNLTQREKEVLRYTAIGNSVEEISKILGISKSTIKNHKTKIFEKLHVINATEAVFYAITHNLI